MHIQISPKSVIRKHKKEMLAFRFVEKGKDGVVVVQDSNHVCTLVIGELKKMTRRKLILLARRVVREALAKKYKTVVINFQDFRRLTLTSTFFAIAKKVRSSSDITISDRELAELLVVNFLMAQFEFRDFLTKPKEGWESIETVILINADTKDIREGVRRGIIIG